MLSLRQSPTIWWEVIGNSEPVAKQLTKSEMLIKQFKELYEGASDSRFAMHVREYCNAYDTGQIYLGDDVVHAANVKEFNELSEAQQNQIKASGNLGKYGLFFHSQKQELTLALEVLKTLKAREIVEDGIEKVVISPHTTNYWQMRVVSSVDLKEETQKSLKDEMTVNAVLMTFPDGQITREKIASAVKSPEHALVA